MRSPGRPEVYMEVPMGDRHVDGCLGDDLEGTGSAPHGGPLELC